MPRKTKHNSVVSPELLSKVNPKNIQLLNDFLTYLRSVQRSEQTIDVYGSDIRIAFVWCLQNNDNRFFIDWTKRNIVAYQNWLINEQGNSPARVRRLKAALSSLSNYICNVLDDEFPDFKNIIHKIENPTLQPVREKTVWKDEELEKLLDILVESKQYEKACFVALAMYSGRRKAELCRFKVSDFDGGKLVCDGALYKSAPILTKGNKYLECYTLAKKFDPYLRLWMDHREQNGITSEWLFPNGINLREHIGVSTVNSWALSLSRLSGKDFYIHSLRHYYCSALIRAGIPDSVIVDIVGWSTSEMLKIYNDNPKDEQIAKYFKNGEIFIPEKKNFGNF